MSVPILVYHSVADRAPAGFAPFAVSPRRFDEQLRFLRGEGYGTLTVSELARIRRGGGEAPARTVVLTFDDGFADFHARALPALAKHGFTATLYVVSGAVGAKSAWIEGAAGRTPMLDWAQLAETARAGVEIGGHGVSHAALDMLSRDEAEAEIFCCKATLEAHLGKRVESFAYPYGLYSRETRRLVAEAGYVSACAVRYANSPRDDDLFALRRQIVRADASLADFAATLRGAAPRRHVDRVRSAGWKFLRSAWRRSWLKTALSQ
ncbi:polysaccharide deacetylase family protein [Methylocystis sp. S23]|jgi:peptidoglycan/xylan/chitin deacetylase (PgdA/CDA1 family)